MKLDKKQINIILIFSFILLCIWGIYESRKQQKIIDEDISKNRYVTIARIKKSHKGNSYTYIYYYDGKKYSGSCSCDNKDSFTLVNRYFKVELSKKNLNILICSVMKKLQTQQKLQIVALERKPWMKF